MLDVKESRDPSHSRLIDTIVCGRGLKELLKLLVLIGSRLFNLPGVWIFAKLKLKRKFRPLPQLGVYVDFAAFECVNDPRRDVKAETYSLLVLFLG